MPIPSTLNFKQTLDLSPAEAFRLFTHATALRDWFSDSAQIDARPGGLVFLGWNSGHYMAGAIKKLEAARKLVFTWDGRGEPEPTTVTVTFKARGAGTIVTVAHGGLGSGAKWSRTRHGVQDGWTAGLENLKSVAETGVDLRQARRPRLGINVGDFNAEIAKQLGVPVARGIHITGTAEGTGARALGWQKGDVLVRLAGKPAVDFPSLAIALVGCRAGQKVPVNWYRGSQKLTGSLELGSFPISAIPGRPDDLAGSVRKNSADIQAGFAKMLEGVSDAEAGAHPGEGWSAKDMIAHFILCERDFQSWAADMLNDVPVDDDFEFRPNVNQRIAGLEARFSTVPALLAELQAAQAETAALLESLPPVFVSRRHLYRRAAIWMLEVAPSHFHDQHAEQIHAAIQAARQN